LDNGMLNIDIERVVPEEKKPRLISVKWYEGGNNNLYNSSLTRKGHIEFS
jgi:hypothetical protein